MVIVKGGVAAPKGFLASGLAAGIKRSGKKDLALLYSEAPAVAAAAFTVNRFQASHIKVGRDHLKGKLHRAIIVNSGNANCANGSAGDRQAYMMAYYVARAAGLKKREVLVASTGVIGTALPIDKIEAAVPSLVSGISREGEDDFAEAIMTTDTVKKELAVSVRLGSSAATIGGACKGVGMIYPDLKTDRHATMLCFITTDASISKGMLAAALAEAIEDSFNMISIDGDMSTNDTCFILANGLAGNKKIETKNNYYNRFTEALRYLAAELARMLVRDGEGATKFVEIKVAGAGSARDARSIARKISTSALLKCCIFGQDPNWGRIAAACGASGVRFDADKVDIYLGGVKVLASGAAVKNYDRDKVKKIFKQNDIYIKVDLKSGHFKAAAWTCDFSKKYVEINSEYST